MSEEVEKKLGYLIHIESSRTFPIYLQIAEQFKLLLATRKLGPGMKLASIRELSEILKVNPNTVAKAFQELEREKLLEKRRGQGTFISLRAEMGTPESEKKIDECFGSRFKSIVLDGVAKGMNISKIRSTVESVLRLFEKTS